MRIYPVDMQDTEKERKERERVGLLIYSGIEYNNCCIKQLRITVGWWQGEEEKF